MLIYYVISLKAGGIKDVFAFQRISALFNNSENYNIIDNSNINDINNNNFMLTTVSEIQAKQALKKLKRKVDILVNSKKK